MSHALRHHQTISEIDRAGKVNVSRLYGSDLQVAGEQSGSLGLGHHGDLLEGQEVVDVDVVLCGVTIPNNSW